MPQRLDGHTALVTGASSGIGADIARILAERGASLVLVARRADRLDRLAEDLRQAHGTTVRVHPADLADAADRAGLAAEMADVDVLVNNAGVGVYGPFADASWQRTQQMLEVNVVALAHLTHLALPAMRRAGWGRIMQVGSIAGFQPMPSYAGYGATKAQILSFGVALNDELRGSGVTCTTLCPGTTETEFFGAAGQKMNKMQRASVMPSRVVAMIGVNAMLRGVPVVVAGRANRLSAIGGRLLPPALAARIAARFMRE